MSRIPITPAPLLPATAAWKASEYRLGYGGFDRPQSIEATPEASWARADTLKSYSPPAKGGTPARSSPHVHFLNLKAESSVKGRRSAFFAAGSPARSFADWFGLLGLFQETLAGPVLSPSANSSANLFVRVAPDAVINQDGKLRAVDPATEGKERLEELLYKRYGPSKLTGRKMRFDLDSGHLALPHELMFVPRGLTPFGRMEPLGMSPNLMAWGDAKDMYGLYVVPDERADSGTSIISTREPLAFWDMELKGFPSPPYEAESLNRAMDGVTPYAIRGEDGEPVRSWRCPSLLKAMYLMLYLDATEDNDIRSEIRKCQAPGCPYYFRASKWSARIYCYPPPGKKDSQCASRASSQMYRDRQRRNRGTT